MPSDPTQLPPEVLFRAVQSGTLEEVKTGILRMLHDDPRDGRTRLNRMEVEDGRTLVSKAAQRGDVAILQTLIESGLDPRSPDVEGWTPMHFAALDNRADAITALHRAEVSTEAKDIYGWTPLHVAASNGCAEAITSLKAIGASAEARSAIGESPVDLARKNNHLHLVPLLESPGTAPTPAPHAPQWVQIAQRTEHAAPKGRGRDGPSPQ